jgi:hypothetical protein
MPLAVLGIAAILSLLYVAALARAGRSAVPAHAAADSYTLRHSPLLRYFSIVALFGGQAGLAIWSIVAPPSTPLMAGLLTAAAVLLGLAGFMLLWESYRWQLRVTATHLECRSPWKPTATRAFGDLARVHYSKAQGWYVLEFAGGARFRVPAVVPGHSRLLQDIRTRRPGVLAS